MNINNPMMLGRYMTGNAPCPILIVKRIKVYSYGNRATWTFEYIEHPHSHNTIYMNIGGYRLEEAFEKFKTQNSILYKMEDDV